MTETQMGFIFNLFILLALNYLKTFRSIDQTEFESLFERLVYLQLIPYNSSQSDALQEMDSDGDGIVTYDEFMQWIEKDKIRKGKMMFHQPSTKHLA